MIKCVVKIPISPFQNRIDYVLKFISQHPLLQGLIEFTSDDTSNFDILLSYGIQQSGAFFIPAQKLIFSDDFSSFGHLIANPYKFSSMVLYSVERVKAPQPKTFFSQNSFQFDILETIFFHISRIEEWNCKDQNLDQWDMMITDQQFLVKHQLHQIPVVDHLVHTFGKALGIQLSLPESIIKITHDIDEVKYSPTLLKSLRASAGIIWRRQNWKSIIQIWSTYLTDQKNEYDTFDWMLSDNSALEKCIYFLVGGNTVHDTPYDLKSPTMSTVFSLCKQRNYTIGIHPSYNCWQDEQLFKSEKKKLEDLIDHPVKISRQHYLHFDFKTTPKILDQQKIKEDSSLGFNDRIGFRCGTGFGYHLYDFENERPFKFIETPLVFMDSALLNETNYDLKKTTQLWSSFLAKNKNYTKIIFNFHNTRFYLAKIHGIPLKEWYQQLCSPNLDLGNTTTKVR